jgi:twitching motility protein PilI
MTTDYFWIDLGLDISVAIPLVKTREVLSFPLSSLCAIPGVRRELLGVSNQRGNLLWVIDLPRLLAPTHTDRRQTPQTLGNTKAVVLAVEGFQAAAIALGFKGILSFEATELTRTDRPFLSALVRQSEAAIGILDVEQIFALFHGGGVAQGVS